MRGNRNQNDWTEELARKVNDLWLEGWTAGDIAHEIGFTRGQVIGKRNRMIKAGLWKGSTTFHNKRNNKDWLAKHRRKQPTPTTAELRKEFKEEKTLATPAPRPRAYMPYQVKTRFAPQAHTQQLPKEQRMELVNAFRKKLGLPPQ